MNDFLPIGITALAAVFVLLLIVVVLRRRGARKKKTVAPPTPPPVAVPTVPDEPPQASSLTSLIGQAKVPEAKPASLRQITAQPEPAVTPV